MKALIIDDEPHCIGALEINLEDTGEEIEVLATCSSGSEGLEALRAYDPDVVFLDIAMPRMNGFEMLARVEKPDFEIIFTTAYDQYALQALKVSAVDYLLKPVDTDELREALHKVRERIEAKRAVDQQSFNTASEHWEMVLENFTSEQQTFPNIAVPTANGFEMVRVASILYVQADGNYSRIFIENKPAVLISKTLKEIHELLARYPFVRVHHSHLVNRNHIERYIRGEGGQVILDNGDAINVSRRRKPELLRSLKQL